MSEKFEKTTKEENMHWFLVFVGFVILFLFAYYFSLVYLIK